MHLARVKLGVFGFNNFALRGRLASVDMEGSDLRASRRSSFIADAMHKMSFTSNMTKAFSRMGRKLSYAQYAPELSALEVAALANATAANEGVQNARLLWERHRLIDPRAVAKHRWDLLMFVFVFYNCVMIPFQLAFLSPLGVLQDELDVLDYVVDAFFWVDIALSFRTSWLTDEWELETSGKAIARRYGLSLSGFPLDFVATFPWELAISVQGIGIAKLPRLFRLSRIMKKAEAMAVRPSISSRPEKLSLPSS